MDLPRPPTSGSSALDHQLKYHQWIICAWQCRIYHNIDMIMENNKRLDLFDTRPHRNIYFISKHQILNQRPLLYRPIMAVYTAAVQLYVHFAIRTANSRRRFESQSLSKIPHTQDERVNPNESVSVVMRFSANLKRKEERKIIRKKKIQYKNIWYIYERFLW